MSTQLLLGHGGCFAQRGQRASGSKIARNWPKTEKSAIHAFRVLPRARAAFPGLARSCTALQCRRNCFSGTGAASRSAGNARRARKSLEIGPKLKKARFTHFACSPERAQRSPALRAAAQRSNVDAIASRARGLLRAARATRVGLENRSKLAQN